MLTRLTRGRGLGGSRTGDHVTKRLGAADRDTVRPGTGVQPPAVDGQRDRLAEHVGTGPDPAGPALVVAGVGEVGSADPRHTAAPGSGREDRADGLPPG